MTRIVVRFALAAALVVAGWLAGAAQTTAPDFVLLVETQQDSAETKTTIKCVEGCGLTWIERGVNPASSVMPEFSFKCSPPETCTSARVGGWIRRR
jgi:hypothetical protein